MVGNHLGARLLEQRQVRIVRPVHGRVLVRRQPEHARVLGARHLAQVKLRVLDAEQARPEDAVGKRQTLALAARAVGRGHARGAKDGGGQVRAPVRAVPEEPALFVARAVVEQLRDGGRRATQAHGGVGVVALERIADMLVRVEAAVVRVQDDAIDEAVLGVALLDDALLQVIELARVRVLAQLVHDDLRPDHGLKELRPVHAGRGGRDAVVVLGVALGQLYALAAALRAAVEVGVLGGLRVKAVDEVLSDDSLGVC